MSSFLRSSGGGGSNIEGKTVRAYTNTSSSSSGSSRSSSGSDSRTHLMVLRLFAKALL